MGLLEAGKPLSWPDSLKYLDYIKKHGILQFLHVWKLYKDRCCDSFKWGDELEYLIVYAPNNENNNNNNDVNKECKLSLRSLEIQNDVNCMLSKCKKLSSNHSVTVHPEYGSFMIEATPLIPYEDNGFDLLNVELNMLYRRGIIELNLKNERLCCLSSFPMLGVDNYSYPSSKPFGPIANSQFISDDIINPHPRFATLTKNIRLRRGQNVDIRVPIFRDKFTPPQEKEIYMDAMAFGMGCCCLQVTFQARDIFEARHLYDQLAVLTPIMMALTASTPFLRGKVSNLDCRWTVISQSVDDRNHHERGIASSAQKNEKNEKNENKQYKRIYKSRYDTIDSFLSTADWLRPEYHDIELVYDEWSYNKMISTGVDDLLAKHMSHLFIRDPIAIYSDHTDNIDDCKSTYHFETIQSTNWQNVRFKPPPLELDDEKDDKNDKNDKEKEEKEKKKIGWRVEFRSMELQVTEFENAAFSIFVTLISRAILFYGLNFYVPISKIDENFHGAHQNNAVLNEKFWWRTCTTKHGNLEMSQMTIKDILCGNLQCRGLISIVKDYIHAIGCTQHELKVLMEYLTLIERRARGDILTGAQWLRKFVYNHKSYKQDSNLTEEICRDIVDITDDIVHGKINAPLLLGHDVNIAQRRKQRLVNFEYEIFGNKNDDNDNIAHGQPPRGQYNEQLSGKLISKL